MRLTFEFEGEPQLAGYTVQLSADAAVSLVLQKSVDGVRWRDVAASGLNIAAGQGRHRRRLGYGTTTSEARPGRAQRGYRFYRLVIVADGDVDIDEVTFTLHGAGRYRNAERVVALYDHLVAGARAARSRTVVPRLTVDRAVVDAAGIVGPFTFHATDIAALSVSAGEIVDADGVPTAGTVAPGTDIYLRTDALKVIITASVPAATDGFGGRVVTGVAYDDERLTPVALATPAPTVIDFEITLAAR